MLQDKYMAEKVLLDLGIQFPNIRLFLLHVLVSVLLVKVTH